MARAIEPPKEASAKGGPLRPDRLRLSPVETTCQSGAYCRYRGLRGCVRRERGSPGRRTARSILASGTHAEHFQEVTVDGEFGVAAEVPDQLVDGTGRERNRRTTARTNQVVAMTGCAD